MESGTLKLAIADPSKINFASKIKNFTKKMLFFQLQLFLILKNCRIQKYGILQAQHKLQNPKVKSVTQLLKVNINIVEFVDKIFQEALKDGTSDIHIEVFKDNVAQIRFRNDGIMKIQERLKSNIISKLYSSDNKTKNNGWL